VLPEVTSRLLCSKGRLFICTSGSLMTFSRTSKGLKIIAKGFWSLILLVFLRWSDISNWRV